MSGKKEDPNKAKPPVVENDVDYVSEDQVEEEDIQDDGEVSSQHSSIDMAEYLRQRDNIPDEPSDAEEEEQSDYSVDDDSQDDEASQDEDEDEPKGKSKPKGKPTKREALNRKKEQKEEEAKGKKSKK